MTSVHGLLSSGLDGLVVSSNLSLSGPNGLMGRTLVLKDKDNGRVVCAPIQPTTRVLTFQALLHTPVAGEVAFRQSEQDTGLFSRLYYVDNTRRDTLHKWTVVPGGESDTLQDFYDNEISRCANLKTRASLIEGSHLLSVGKEPTDVHSISYFLLQNLLLLHTQHRGLYFVLYSAEDVSKIIACAPLSLVEPKVAKAEFQEDGLGEVVFQQDSPYDPTILTVNLKNLQQRAYSYGINNLPMVVRWDNAHIQCRDIKGDIYNPFRLDPEEVPEPGKGTVDQYAVGDLSGKHGTLHNRKEILLHERDSSLTLFGIRSIIGRALAIFYPDGKPLACVNIELTGKSITTAYTTFDYPIQGQLIFKQDASNPLSDTSIYVELSHPSGSQGRKTFNHLWHVHIYSIKPDQHYSSTSCAVAGTHYNPFNVSNTGIYACHCSGRGPSRCEMGDSSGKFGPLDIPVYSYRQDGTVEIARYFFTDPYLSLSGPNTIVGRSVVVHLPDFSTSRMACSNIVEHQK
ncbi:uncharacterized protein LOC106476364 [Limulus polyphemus]|uniref:Uncharacterized protein LOC106476364 n=1 Tax=Limulus polyphemus TaxID=6850 RepID=A0ABM1C186_LIMPO|nr:uncharacterized protein LOC106476364 [Limulus polyphemus]